jgi:hypothetical protein
MPDQLDPILKNTIDVVVDGVTFVFRIPSFADSIKLGLRAKQIRRELELEMLGPNPTIEEQSAFTGGESTYDASTETYVQTAAQFSILLKHADVEWIYSKDEKGNPVCDYKKWPDDKFNVIVAAGVDFSNQLRRFRSGGPAAPKPPVVQTMDSQQDSQDQPVQSGDAGSHGTTA